MLVSLVCKRLMGSKTMGTAARPLHENRRVSWYTGTIEDGCCREMKRDEKLSQTVVVSWNSRAREGRTWEAAGVTMARDICHAWLHSPLPTMGPEDQPWMSFFSLPSFPGTLLSRTIGLLSLPHFLPAFNPSILLFFQPSLSVSTRKQNKVETMTVHSPPSATVVLMTFCSSSALCVCVNMLKPFYLSFLLWELDWLRREILWSMLVIVYIQKTSLFTPQMALRELRFHHTWAQLHQQNTPKLKKYQDLSSHLRSIPPNLNELQLCGHASRISNCWS